MCGCAWARVSETHERASKKWDRLFATATSRVHRKRCGCSGQPGRPSHFRRSACRHFRMTFAEEANPVWTRSDRWSRSFSRLPQQNPHLWEASAWRFWLWSLNSGRTGNSSLLPASSKSPVKHLLAVTEYSLYNRLKQNIRILSFSTNKTIGSSKVFDTVKYFQILLATKWGIRLICVIGFCNGKSDDSNHRKIFIDAQLPRKVSEPLSVPSRVFGSKNDCFSQIKTAH